MATQGSYPLGSRTLAPTDTVTGVVTGGTADIPLSTLQTFIVGGTAGGGVRPTPTFIGQQFFDTNLGLPIWAQSLSPTVWVNAAGVQV